jgi:hypothetical protein
MDKGRFYADNELNDLMIAMNALRTIPRIVHNAVFEDGNPESVDVVEAIVESGLKWVEKAMQELVTGWPDVVEYKTYGFCEVGDALKEAQTTAGA